MRFQQAHSSRPDFGFETSGKREGQKIGQGANGEGERDRRTGQKGMELMLLSILCDEPQRNDFGMGFLTAIK